MCPLGGRAVMTVGLVTKAKIVSGMKLATVELTCFRREPTASQYVSQITMSIELRECIYFGTYGTVRIFS